MTLANLVGVVFWHGVVIKESSITYGQFGTNSSVLSLLGVCC